jgi:hypothetical protein
VVVHSLDQLWLAPPLPYQQTQWDTAPLGNLEDLQLGDSQEEVEVEAEAAEVEVEAEVGAVVAEEVFLQENKQQEASHPKHQPSMA